MSNMSLSRESDAGSTKNRIIDRSSKVDIKGICQKFENLSGVIESKINSEISSTPVVPVRKKKTVTSSKTVERTRSVDLNLKSVMLSNSVKSNSTPSSVKEKTKLFESPIEMNKIVSNSATSKLNRNSIGQSMLLTGAVKGRNGSKIVDCSSVIPSSVPIPPAKPPRSFAHLDLTADEHSEISNNAVDVTPTSEMFPSLPTEFKTRNASFSFERKSEEEIQKTSRPNSASEIFVDSSKKAPQSTPKSLKFSGKTQTLVNYLKNISNTANNLCEKVKQKHTNIFVDLTPTTVSPPKHYGTLKRSLSEEHIYAEPAAICKSDSNKPEDPVIEPLHYMCTSLIPPAVPYRERAEESKFTSSQSVRNMIYGSFAGVRAAPKDTSENHANAPVAESGEADISMKAIQARIIYVKSVRKQVSSSSICLAPKLYEAVFIVNVIEEQPQVTHSFPLKIADEYNIPLLPHICFPASTLWKAVSVYQSETFHFTLMDKEETIFGYCLRIQGWPESGYANESLCVKAPLAICILSSFSAPVFYRKLLYEIEKHLTLPRNIFFKYIRSLQKLGVPNAGASLSIPDCSESNEEGSRVIVSRPLDSHFVSLEMTRTLQLLDVDILVKCVASLFLERRILFFSASTSNLYHCCKAISSLLYPFEWPHLIVPVLPACLTIHCCSEQPYILGIINNNCDSVLELLAEHELLIIDVDKGAVIKSCNDEDTILPRKVQKAVISALNLAKNMTDPTEMLRDIMISEAFVHMSVEMIGHYENYFTEVNGNITFQKESFLKNAFSHNIRFFLQWFSETQMFDSFIEDSLWRMKYRNICQTNMRSKYHLVSDYLGSLGVLKTFFEKRVDEYKWELSHDGEKISRIIGKTVRNFGEMLKGLKKS